MFILAIFLCGLFAWLLYETKWLTIRLAAGQLPRREPNLMTEAVVQPQFKKIVEAVVQPQRNLVMVAIIYLLAIAAAEVVILLLSSRCGEWCATL